MKLNKQLIHEQEASSVNPIYFMVIPLSPAHHPIPILDPQDLKNQTARLLRDTASLSSELALATAVLEAVGILPKEDADASDAAAAAVASPPAMPRWKRGQVSERD